MSPYKFMDKPGLERLANVDAQALGDTEKKISQTRKLILEYESLIKNLNSLLEKNSDIIMIPFGNVAYMPGVMVPSNRVLMSIGGEYLIDTPVQHARQIVERNLAPLEVHLGKLAKQKKMLESSIHFVHGFKKEEEECKEIVEHYTEEEYNIIQEQHKENVKKSRENKLKDNVDLDEIFSQYKDEEEEEEEEEEEGGQNKSNELDANVTASDLCRIDEGFKSFLSEIGINPEDLGSEENAMNVDDDCKPLPSNSLPKEGSESNVGVIDSCVNGSTLPRVDEKKLFEVTSDRLTNERRPAVVDETNVPLDVAVHEDEVSEVTSVHQMMEGMMTAVDVTNGTSEAAETENNKTDPTANRKNRFGESNQSGVAEPKESVKQKKSVRWVDEVTHHTEYNDSGKEYEDDDDDDEEDGDENMRTIVVNFKHSSVKAVGYEQPSTEEPNHSLLTPGNILMQMYKPKSILKKSCNPPQTSIPTKPREEKKPHKVVRDIVMGEVVEHNLDSTRPLLEKSSPTSQTTTKTTRVSMYKASKMAK